MQISLHPSIQTENEYESAHDNDNKNISFSNLFFNHLTDLYNYGYQKKDILILVRARKLVPTIQHIIKSENYDKFSFTTMTYHNFAEKILCEYGFLRNKQRLKVIGRYDQLRIIKEICFSRNRFLNYKEIFLFIAKCKSQNQNDSKKINFSSFLQSKPSIHKVIDMSPDFEVPQFSDYEIDNYASDIFQIYQNVLKRRKMADHEDLINFSTQIMKRNSEVITFYRRRYKFAFMDNTNKFLTKKKNIKNFLSLLFINNENTQEPPINNDKEDDNMEYSNFRFFSINSNQKHFQNSSKPVQYSSPPPLESFSHENADSFFSFESSDFNQNKLFSEVSDFDAEGENGFNIDVLPFGMNNNSKECDQEDQFKENENKSWIEREPIKNLSDFEEEEEGFLSDFDYENEYEIDGHDIEESSESGMNCGSSWPTKNKLHMLNSIKKKKPFKNNYLFFNSEPIIFDGIENNNRKRRYSYYGQNLILKEISGKFRTLSNQIGKAVFFSDDNYE